jgi:hypothetical protein
MPQTATGLTRRQAERRLCDPMDEVRVTAVVELTVEVVGRALVEQLEAVGWLGVQPRQLVVINGPPRRGLNSALQRPFPPLSRHKTH